MEVRFKRIDGWKAIGNYLGRDRSTAIRWANERGLPVQKIPGGRTATVFARKDDLDTWIEQQNLGTDAGVAEQAASPAIPSDPAAAALFIDANDHWSQRTAESIARAIIEFEALIDRAPDFAPAYAGLAMALVGAANYGDKSVDTAFARAGKLLRDALALDPALPSARGVLAFIAYWWEHDPVTAGFAFREAINLAPADPELHRWYGGVLADNGEFDAAAREFDRCRLGSPGGLLVETNRALVKWQSHDPQAGIADLEAIARRNPEFPLTWHFLGIVYLCEGDAQALLRVERQRAVLRGERGLISSLAQIERAYDAGGSKALFEAIVACELAGEADRPFPCHAVAAMAATVTNDRDRLVSILELAGRNRECWGSASLTSRIAKAWKDDPEIVRLLRRRIGPKVEPPEMSDLRSSEIA